MAIIPRPFAGGWGGGGGGILRRGPEAPGQALRFDLRSRSMCKFDHFNLLSMSPGICRPQQHAHPFCKHQDKRTQDSRHTHTCCPDRKRTDWGANLGCSPSEILGPGNRCFRRRRGQGSRVPPANRKCIPRLPQFAFIPDPAPLWSLEAFNLWNSFGFRYRKIYYYCSTCCSSSLESNCFASQLWAHTIWPPTSGLAGWLVRNAGSGAQDISPSRRFWKTRKY